jgi:glycine oxidase
MTDFIIVGGGLIGMLTARELALDGASVAIYERHSVGGESSWAGGGILSPLYPWRYADAVTELAQWSQARYAQLAEELYRASDVDPEWLPSGLLMLGIDDSERQQAADWAKRFGYRLAVLDNSEARELQPGLGEISGHHLWMPEVAQMRNPRLLQAVRRDIERRGVTIREHVAVSGLLQSGGRVTGIRTQSGEFTAGSVIIAGGAWSGVLASQFGFELAVEPVRGQMLLFKASPELLSHIILSEERYVIPRRDGHVLIGSTLEHTGFDKHTTEAAREELIAHARRILPALAQCPIEKQWAGLRPGSAEGIPFISAVPGFEGLYVNAGHYRNGVVTGLASARLLADIALSRDPVLDAAPYRIVTKS